MYRRTDGAPEAEIPYPVMMERIRTSVRWSLLLALLTVAASIATCVLVFQELERGGMAVAIAIGSMLVSPFLGLALAWLLFSARETIRLDRTGLEFTWRRYGVSWVRPRHVTVTWKEVVAWRAGVIVLNMASFPYLCVLLADREIRIDGPGQLGPHGVEASTQTILSVVHRLLVAQGVPNVTEAELPAWAKRGVVWRLVGSAALFLLHALGRISVVSLLAWFVIKSVPGGVVLVGASAGMLAVYWALKIYRRWRGVSDPDESSTRTHRRDDARANVGVEPHGSARADLKASMVGTPVRIHCSGSLVAATIVKAETLRCLCELDDGRQVWVMADRVLGLPSPAESERPAQSD